MERITTNPFYVLGLSPDASRAEVERAAQTLLGLLEVGQKKAQTYPTPLGAQQRTPEMVREAAATLRDPEARLVAEVWARRPPEPTVTAPASEPAFDALEALGWR